MIWGRLMLLLVAAWIVQAYLTWRQVQGFQATVRQLARRPDGFLGIGVWRKGVRPGAVTVLVTDADGRVTAGRSMTGITVFTKLRPDSRWTGKTVDEVLAEAEAVTRPNAIVRASISACNQIQKQRETAQNTAAPVSDGAPTLGVVG